MFSENINKNTNSQAWAFLSACVTGVLLFYPTLADMFSMWWEDGSAYSHGLLLMLVVVYFFLKQWNRDKNNLSIHPKIWMLPVILSLSILWMLAYLSQVQALEQLLLLLMLMSIVFALLAPARAVPYIYIITLMIFTISSWSQIIGFLRVATTIVSAYLLDLTGMTSVREGFLILIPAGTFEVTDSCSGLRYQLAGLSISFIYAYMERFSFWKTFLYLLTASVIIFFANTVRIYIVILAGQLTNMQSPLVDDHQWVGWVVFSLFMGTFLYFSSRITGSHDQDDVVIEETSSARNEITPVSKWLYTVMILALTASGPILARFYAPPDEYSDDKYKLELPASLNAWTYNPLSRRDRKWQPDFESPDVMAGGRYADNNRPSALPVDYYMIIYAYQTQGHEAININNRVYNENGWTLIKNRKMTINLANSKSMAVNEFEIKGRSGANRLVWMWYYVDSKNIASKYKAKIAGLLGVFRQRPVISVNIVSVPLSTELEPARATLTEFLSAGLQGMNTLSDKFEQYNSVKLMEIK